MNWRIPKFLILSTLFFVLLYFPFKGLAKENFDFDICENPEEIDNKCESLSKEGCRAILEKCQTYLEEKSALIEKDITKTAAEKKTLQNQIYYLGNKIKNLNYQIYQSNLMIKDLGFQVSDTEASIEKTSLGIEESRQKLINILRSVYEEDQRSLVEVLLAEGKLSDFFDNLVYLETLDTKNQELLTNIKKKKEYLEGQKQKLEGEKQDYENLVVIQTLKKKENEGIKRDKNYYLKLTEAEYQKQLQKQEDIEKNAAEISHRLFELIGVAEGGIEFGEAVKIAKYVEGITGVRAAFLLAILKQESDIGKNVGQCYLKNRKTGAGVIVSTGKAIPRVMKPMGLAGRKGDVNDFLQICKELGRNPYSTLVSCPMSYGYGGAMGPAQFIPTTWVLYKDKVKGVTGSSADPWNIKDAFLASSLYLAELGASKQTYNAEWAAAMRYFSGSTNLRYRFYGDSVMSIASRYTKDIAAIEKAGK